MFTCVIFQEVHALHKHEMEIKLDNAKSRMLFLLDYTILTREDVALNNMTFSWGNRFNDILEEYELSLPDVTKQFQEALKV